MHKHFVCGGRRCCCSSRLAYGVDRVLHLARVEFGTPDRCEEIVEFGKPGLGRDRVEIEGGRPRALQFALDRGATMRDGLLELRRLEPLPYFGARAMAMDISEIGIEPVTRGTTLLDRDDLDFLTASRWRVQRHHHAIDLGAAATMTKTRMHCVGKVTGVAPRGKSTTPPCGVST